MSPIFALQSVRVKPNALEVSCAAHAAEARSTRQPALALPAPLFGEGRGSRRWHTLVETAARSVALCGAEDGVSAAQAVTGGGAEAWSASGPRGIDVSRCETRTVAACNRSVAPSYWLSGPAEPAVALAASAVWLTSRCRERTAHGGVLSGRSPCPRAIAPRDRPPER